MYNSNQRVTNHYLFLLTSAEDSFVHVCLIT